VHRCAIAAVVLMACWVYSAAAQSASLRTGGYAPEDPALRAEAVRLVERANLASTPGIWPPNEMVLRFHVGDPPAGFPIDGDYVSSIGGAGLRRQVWSYGDFHYTQVRNGQRLKLNHGTVTMPAVLQVLNEIAPIYLVRFDNQDIIRATGSPSEGTRCIQFDTVTGERTQSNEICVDEKNGWLTSIRAGDVVTKNSNFFPFGQSFLPGHIERWRGNRLLMSVDETVTLKNDYPPEYFDVPADSPAFLCPDFRRAFEIHTPQPEPRRSSTEVMDIRLYGYIDQNGRVGGLKPIETTYPDLNAEAIQIVSKWTYAPAQCGGKPAWWQTTFTVHFKGR
jgi:hypothetical protein